MRIADISVAICTYNGAAFILQQVQSIFTQTVIPRELVVSDDGSQDETVEIINAYWNELRNKRPELHSVQLVLLQNPKPLGVTKNFEQAINACQFELIALSDQDDCWVQNKIETLENLFLRDEDLILVFSDSKLVDAAGNDIGLTSFEALRVSRAEREKFQNGKASQVLLRRNLATGATVMFRKKLMDSAAPFPKEWVHDEWLALVASFVGHVRMEEACLIDYRQHGNNQIGMSKPGIRHYLGRLVFPRTQRNAVLFSRAKNMSEHHFFTSSGTFPFVSAQEKLAHEQFRQNIPNSRIRRLFPVLAERKTGRYDAYGLGMQDVARDLIQPV